MHNQSSLPLGTPTSSFESGKSSAAAGGGLRVCCKLKFNYQVRKFSIVEYPMINGSDCTFTFRYYLRCPLRQSWHCYFILDISAKYNFYCHNKTCFLCQGIIRVILWSCQQNEDILKNYGTFMCFESIFPGLLS